MQYTCEKCKDKGMYRFEETSPDGLSTSSGPVLCECRRSLPRREGNARYWVSDDPIELTAQAGIYDDASVTIKLTPELPVSEDNYPLLRTEENCYYPPSIEVSSKGRPFFATSDELRVLAKLFTDAADKCDSMCEPVSM